MSRTIAIKLRDAAQKAAVNMKKEFSLKIPLEYALVLLEAIPFNSHLAALTQDVTRQVDSFLIINGT